MLKLVLKLFVFPILFVIKIVCILGNLFTNIISYAVGLLLLVIAGCAIFCIVKAMWQSLAILAGMGLAAFAVLFLLVWVVVKAETFCEFLGDFLRS